MGEFVGIDLGTTNSVVAVVDSSGARVLDNLESKAQTPSVVSLRKRRKGAEAGKTELLIGQPALDNRLLAPEETIVSIKRLMGRAFDDEEVAAARANYSYRIVAPTVGTKDSVRVVLGGTEYSPIEVSAMILAKLKADAEHRLQSTVTHAVITVPAYFGEAQRDATRRAAVAAGLNVIKLLDEPTAAAVSFGVDTSESDEPRRILVYDLGGGTFDISILMMTSGILAPLCLLGDMWLGGDDFDQVLVDHVLGLLRDPAGEYAHRLAEVNPADDKRFMVALRGAAREVKERLTSAKSADIVISSILHGSDRAPVDIEEEISRAEYEDMIAPIVQKTIDLTRRALQKARMTVNDIDLVLMAGNATCVPMVQRELQALFGSQSSCHLCGFANPSGANRCRCGEQLRSKILRKENPMSTAVGIRSFPAV